MSLEQKRYWKKFYNDFSDFQYKELGHFDNYVGHNFKMIRTFFIPILKHREGYQ